MAIETDELEDKDSAQEKKGQQPIPAIGQAMLVPRPTGMPPAVATPPIVQPQGQQPAIQMPTPEKPAIAKLWDKTANIENPFAKILARTGTGILGASEGVGEALFPQVAAMIPQSEINTRIRNRDAEKRFESGQAMQVAQQKAGAEESTAAAAKRKADTEAEKEKWEETHPKTGLTPEEQFMNDALHGGQNGSAKLDAQGKPYTYLTAHGAWKQQEQDTKPEKPDTETQEAQRYEKIQTAQGLKQPVSTEDTAWARAYEKRKTLAPYAGAAAQAPQKNTERADRSFQYNNTALDKVSTPVEQAQARMGRLSDAIAQNTPQADALIAPELLSVMAGGAGSGLRMNEAEINRIVGGRSKWESLKAAVNQWSLDPSKATSITAEQRQEIRALTTEVQKKLTAKQQIIDDARNALIDSDDPKEHRRIVADAKRKLDAIDSGQSGEGQKRTVKIGGSGVSVGDDGKFQYQGHTYKANADGKSATLVK